MTKKVFDIYWTTEEENKSLNVGFTQSFIDDILGECFHILQADTKTVVKDSPMLVIETNDGLQSIKSPVTGKVLYFNPKARNFPDRIKESEIILTLLPAGVVIPKTKPKVEPIEVDATQDFQAIFNRDFEELLPPPLGRRQTLEETRQAAEQRFGVGVVNNDLVRVLNQQENRRRGF